MDDITLFDGPCGRDTARAVRSALAAALPAPRRGDVALAATELITNAVRAGASTVRVTLSVSRSHLSIAVRDDAPGIPVPRQPLAIEEAGRGLHIVAAVADGWGYDNESEHSKTVWARFGINADD